MNHSSSIRGCIAAICLLSVSLFAISQENKTTERLYNGIANGAPDGESISIVRETALREVAVASGALAGLKDRSCELGRIIASNSAELDHRYRFNALVMGVGMLPPVITEARDSVSRGYRVMRVGAVVYHLDEPAMLVDIVPTWRDWIYVGLDAAQCGKPAEIPALSSQLRPQNDLERQFVKVELERAYKAGRDQAQRIYDVNVNRLERTYTGMRRYFELYERGMISAPKIISSTDIVSLDDPNTLVVGNTLIQIIKEAAFVTKDDSWKPLAP